MINFSPLFKSLPFVLFASLPQIWAEDSQSIENIYILEGQTIIGSEDEKIILPGSAHLINEESLGKFEYDDIHRILSEVPGVYIREEDGYGLRPNIGMRGGNSDRSKKVVLMEDSILFGPAPYSAPAAYFFPLMTRMEGVEVFKGPSAIKYGPNTIGGAINVLSKSIPEINSGAFDFSLGTDGYFKTHAQYGGRFDNGGYLIEGIHLQSDGFKTLSNGENTGFEKDEFLAKFIFHNDNDASYFQQWEIKLNYSQEDSNETYLGISDSDFTNSPYKRYAASALDNMDWNRQGYQVRHLFSNNKGFFLNSTLYHHNFERSWYKFNSIDRQSAYEILRDPTTLLNAVYYDILSGNNDTSNETIYIGNNHREYYSQGLQFDGSFDIDPAAQRFLYFGLRFHRDEIDRNHTEDEYSTIQSTLNRSNTPTATTTRNTHQSEAISLYSQLEYGLNKWLFTPGVRFESIENDATDHLGNSSQSDSQTILLPGLGISYSLNNHWVILAGSHLGYSPVAPGQTSDIEAEESINSEIGFRYNKDSFNIEAIAFLNDYSNLTDNDRQSTGGTGTGIQYNGGEAEILGLEFNAKNKFSIGNDLTIPSNLSYTFTQSEFKNNFISPNSQWGTVVSGDELPYIPEQQLNFSIGLEKKNFNFNISYKYLGSMLEQAGQRSDSSITKTDTQNIIDLSGNLTFKEKHKIYTKVDNLFDKKFIVSRRPYGARPGKPFQLQIGYKLSF